MVCFVVELKKVIQRVFWRVSAELDRALVLARNDMYSAIFPNALLSCVLYVDPLKITWRCKMRAKEQSSRRIFPDGDWDLNRELMADYEAYDYRYISCDQMINEGLAYKRTQEYAVYLDKLGRGEQARGMSTVLEVDSYMSSMEAFYRQTFLSRELKTQRSLGGSSLYGEINCVIGRDGELLKADDGNHRFAIARVCGLRTVPIQVSMVHPKLVRDLVGNIGALSAARSLNEYLHAVESRYA